MFSVIIPTCKRLDMLAQCLDRLACGAQSLASSKFEVIVTDDGDTSETREEIERRYKWVQWCAGPRMGPAANRNNGAKHGRGEWLVFTDDDCIPDPGWLEAYEKGIELNPLVSVFEGRIYADRPQRSWCETSPQNEAGGCLWSANLAVKKSVFERLSGFEERFPYATMEDVEFRYRLSKCGEKLVYVHGAGVYHPWRLKKGWMAVKRHFESTLIFMEIHPEVGKLTTPWSCMTTLLRMLWKDTIPNFIKFRGAGFKYAVYENMFYFMMAYKLCFKKGNSLAPKHNCTEAGTDAR